MNKEVSLITFHASHNFGSVMQAYALKRTVNLLGNHCTIINFRPEAQIDKYSALPVKYGAKYFTKAALQLFTHPVRRGQSLAQYEEFISKYLTNEPRIIRMSGLKQLDSDVLLTGSDQVWGYQIPEFVKSKEDVRPAYYFSFSEGRKVSYASSVGTATAAQLTPYAGLLSTYDCISVREASSVRLISELSGKPVKCTLDPTFLLNLDEYMRLVHDVRHIDVPDGRYCFIYSLQGIRARSNWLKLARIAEEKLGLPMISASHFVPLRGAGIVPTLNIGPIDILALFAHASYILTDTFHGTLFSTHFKKPFISYLPERDDPRIQDISMRLGLEDRVVHSLEKASEALDCLVDYDNVYRKRLSELNKSIDYLVEAIGEE